MDNLNSNNNKSESTTTITIGTRSHTRSAISEHIRQLEQDKTHEYYPGTERTRYDFTAERRKMFKMHALSSIGHLMKTSIGVGILVIPYGFMIGGLYFSMVCSIIFGTIIYTTGAMLVDSAHKLYTRHRIPSLTYPEMVGLAAEKSPWKSVQKKAKTIKIIADILQYSEQIGTCCVFILIITSTLQHVVKSRIDDLSPTYSIRVFIMIVFLILGVVCLIRAMRILVPVSLFAELFVFIVVIGLFIYGIIYQRLDNISERKITLSTLDEFVVCTSVILYAYDVIMVIMPVENHINRPMLFILLYRIAMVLIVLCITAIGFFGYNYYGEECLVPITQNLHVNLLSLIIQIAVMISLCITFSTQFWIPYKLLCRFLRKSRAITCKMIMVDSLLRLLFLLFITAIALTIPDCVQMIVIISGFFLSLLSFVVPPFIDTIVTWPEHPGGIRWRLIRNITIMVVGVLMMLLTFLYFCLKLRPS